MDLKFISILYLLVCLKGISQVQNHTIQLTVDLKPYINARDIEAQVFINHNLRASIRADNSAFARIFGHIPKMENDSIFEVQIVVNSPIDYIALERQMPFRYFPGTGKRVIVASKTWLRENALAYGKSMTNNNTPDTSINFIASVLNEDLFKNTSQEVELTRLLAKNYAAIGDFTESYNSLASISNNKLKALSVNQQIMYYADLLDKFKLATTRDTALSNSTDYFANAISQNDTAYRNWKILTNKVLSGSVGKKVDIELFKAPYETANIFSAQVSELTDKLHRNQTKQTENLY